jgi:peptidoglycan-associated lipoprotein
MRALHRLLTICGVLAVSVALTGCPKKPDTLPDSGATPMDPSATTSTTTTGSDVTGSGLSADQREIERLKQTGMIVYFDFDRAEIKAEYVPIVQAHAKFLNGNAARKVRLEGHSDERGSREYNIGLGERRAQAVRRALMLQGVTDMQITTVSYGEERPSVAGSDETAYARNRRVELVYGR